MSTEADLINAQEFSGSGGTQQAPIRGDMTASMLGPWASPHALDGAAYPRQILSAFPTFAPAVIGDNQVVAAVGGFKIRLLAGYVTSNIAVNVRWRSAANNVDALLTMVAGERLPFDKTAGPWLDTNVGEALNLNASAAANLGVRVLYVLIPG